MGPVRDLKTRLVNKTGQRIGFDVDGGICPLRGLPPGKSRSVSLSLMFMLCRKRGSADWSIRVLINDRFHGMYLHPRLHILKMTRIVFRYKWRADGSCVQIAEGVVETFFDRVFGCCINWEKRIYVEIAEADSTWRSIRSSQHSTIVGPPVINGNNLPLSEVGNHGIEAAPPQNSLQLRQENWRKKIILAFPKQKMRLRLLWNDANSNASVESRKRRLYRLLSLRRRDMFNRFLLFVLAFILVGSMHLVLYN